MSNGSLANNRIINSNRNEKALFMVYNKFRVDVSTSKLLLFKSAVIEFIKDRPREFVQNKCDFQLVRVDSDLGCMEYAVIAQSQYSWHERTLVLISKAKIAAFCLELQRKLKLINSHG